jgi:HEPN domain-containing protein
MRTRPVDRARYPLFLARAEEFLATAQTSLAQGRRQAAAANAVHAAIAAMDAVSVFHAGMRSASERHEEAVDLLTSLGLPDADFRTRTRQFGRLLRLKTKAEYADTWITAREAGDAVRTAERLLAWVRSHLPPP